LYEVAEHCAFQDYLLCRLCEFRQIRTEVNFFQGVGHMSAATQQTPEPAKRVRRRSLPDVNALAFTIRDAQALGAPGRTKIYALFASGRLKRVKIGGTVMICGDSLRALLRGAE
jgi:hypothetical protein